MHVLVDERVVKNKGRFICKQYVRMKPTSGGSSYGCCATQPMAIHGIFRSIEEELEKQCHLRV